jgi:ATP-dependent helicase HepA
MSTRSAFVQVGRGTDGVGKLLEFDRKQAEIEYFESPVGPRVRRVQAPVGSVRELELSPQTRVFWFDKNKNAWRAGRVDGGLISAEALKATEDHYPVRFPNGHDAHIPISELNVRWARPIEDPTDYLAARITDTPLFFDGRFQIVRYLANQRAAFGGITGLASAAVELLEHQVTTVRRILADPVERYLLADEVGLGKTIEAGVLIRQHVLDRPNEAAVVVVVPVHLVRQWRLELASKFFLSESSPVQVLSEHEFIEHANDLDAMTMLVVDEAHRPALRAFELDPEGRRLYDALETVAARVPRLLLLSGTPVLHQEEGFLAMLHLLDPQGYPLNDREQFRRRVHERQTVAEATLDLTDDASVYFVGEALQRLETLFADDSRLLDLCTAVRELVLRDTADPARVGSLRALRTHLTETYRLHRRLLRTRRGDPRVQVHLPQRTGALRLEYDDEARREAFDFLDAWRLALPVTDGGDPPHTQARLFSLWVAAALSDPRTLARHIDSRLALRRRESSLSISSEHRETLAIPWLFDAEETLLRERRELILRAAETDCRAQRFVTWLRSNVDIKKVVVFVDDREIADLLASTLREALGSGAVLRYDDASDAVRTFEERESLAVLICDATAEEGLNLQRHGATLVHFDLPLEPARIEQRIGRIDRLEAKGRLRNVVFSTGCPYEHEWLTCLSETICVFDRSIAPLQYVLVEATGRIRSRLLEDGRSAIELEAARMRDPQTGLDAELRRIRAQESLDSVEGDGLADAAFFAMLAEADETAETEGEKALNSWVTQRLQFGCRQIAPAVLRYTHDLRRPTLIPLFDTFRRFETCIDRDPRARDSKATLPLKPATFARSTAETAHVGLLRVGHPFVDAFEALVRSDDRGTAFAMWRYVPKSTRVPRMFFRFDFVIEADLAAIKSGFEGDVSIESLRRQADDGFPVEYQTIWLNGDLQPVLNDRVLAVLARPYQKEPRADGSRDVNLRLERWDRVDALVAIGDWGDLCYRAREVAERQIRDTQEFRERCHQHATKTLVAAANVNEALKSRISRMSGSVRDSEEKMADLELRLSEALAAGIESPFLRVDSVGAVVLASELWEEA